MRGYGSDQQPSSYTIPLSLSYLTWRYEDIRSLAHGGQQQNLNLEMVRDLLFATPPSHAEQDEIVSIIDAIDRKIDLHRRKRHVLEGMSKSLLRELMTA
ncbi:restriction endonuclease subunit S [Xylella fastidiosa]|uniref:restriction endonuclease subunit S n=1 Tax=Xylella fastidiosa TaxID=2371 RepID=UPI001EFF78F6|nr:restriction endonuclease subunit S [Xylella fastidiosa]